MEKMTRSQIRLENGLSMSPGKNELESFWADYTIKPLKQKD